MKPSRRTYGECLANGDTVAAEAERCGIAVSTAFRWRHRFLAGISTNTEKLKGIVEADQIFFLEGSVRELCACPLCH